MFNFLLTLMSQTLSSTTPHLLSLSSLWLPLSLSAKSLNQNPEALTETEVRVSERKREAMDRLLSSSSPTPLKIHHFKSSPFVPRLGRIDSVRLSFASSTRPDFRRLTSLSCKHGNPSTSSSPSSFSTPSIYFVCIKISSVIFFYFFI